MNKKLKFLFLLILLTGVGTASLMAQTENSSANTKTKIRLAIMPVKTTGVGEGIDAGQLGAGVKNTLSEYLKSPDIELIEIEAELPAAVEAEIKEKKVDYLVFVSASHKKGGGGFGKMFGKVAPILGQAVPMAGAAGGIGGAIAGQVASTAIMTTATMSSNVKAKDSLQLDLSVRKVEPKSSPFAKNYKAKAKSDGEDIITPLIEQMAQAVIDYTQGKSTNPAKESN